jgi:CheY-like chemotaxis protein
MKKINILIIDDEISQCAIIKDIFDELGYICATANNCDEAVALVKKTNFDIILLDLVLPDKNGVEIFREIKTIRPKAKAILFTGLITGFGQQKDLELMISAKANGIIDEYLRKPLKIAELMTIIKKYTEDNISIK